MDSKKRRSREKSADFSSLLASNDAVKEAASFKILKLALDDLGKEANTQNSADKKLLEQRKITNLLEILNLAASELNTKYNINSATVINQLRAKATAHEITIPSSIFNKELSSFESICKYLKENLHLKFSEIARLLSRDSRTIWSTYNNAKKKKPSQLIIADTEYLLPVSIFQNSELTILESIILYLKDAYSLSYKAISILLYRDQRNIWTIYNRVKKKFTEKNAQKPETAKKHPLKT
ncbi:TPA: hypothetical protein HA246_02835 [Candidatus Woesearchaeota archaeon]|nr:hypothetical protein [Candidatus Woesearchaeota archaeon]